MTQLTENPATYTKLFFFLPWVARQYGLSYDGDPTTDETCSQGSGGTAPPQPCRETISSLITTEHECIFPGSAGSANKDKNTKKTQNIFQGRVTVCLTYFVQPKDYWYYGKTTVVLLFNCIKTAARRHKAVL